MEIEIGKYLTNVPLAKLNTWHVGGSAEKLYCPRDLQDLSQFLAQLPADETLTWLGLGSNVLIRDGGIKGTVILTHGGLTELTLLPSGILHVGAGVPCAIVAKFVAKHKLSGAHFLSGIPGTIGGALAMNAGAFGGEMWSIVESVEIIRRDGRCETHAPQDFEISYRTVNPKISGEFWFVSANLKLAAGNSQEEDARIRALLHERKQSQPIGLPSCGSVFRNPTGNHAARLIEQCGLKGLREGGAYVSEKHANFIINDGNATAHEIETLINHVQTVVASKTGIILVPEVRILGQLLD